MKRTYNKSWVKKEGIEKIERREIQIVTMDILMHLRRSIALLKNNDIVVDDLNNWIFTITRRGLKKLSLL